MDIHVDLSSSLRSWIKAAILWEIPACKIAGPLQILYLSLALFLHGEAERTARHRGVVSALAVTVWVEVEAEEVDEVRRAPRIY